LDDTAAADAGAVFIYVRNGNGWTQQARLTAGDAAAQDRFGYALALDGDTLAVATRPVNSGVVGQPAPRWAVYVFRRANGVWTQQTRIAPNETQDQFSFGWSLSLDADTLAIGGPSVTATGDFGAAFVYVFANGAWQRQARLPFGNNSSFGYSVAVRGNLLAVGAPRLEGLAQPAGSVQLYNRNGAAWTQGQLLLPRSQEFPLDGVFGASVAVSAGAIAVSSFSTAGSTGLSGQAVVYVFYLDNGAWHYRNRLDAAGTNNPDTFGYDNLNPLAIDANYILLGNEFTVGPGDAYLFRPNSSNSAWLQHTRLTPTDQAANVSYGTAVALAHGRAFVGDVNTGAVYVYESLANLAAPNITLTTSPQPSLAGQPVTFRAEVRDGAGNPLTGKVHFYISRSGSNFYPRLGPADVVNGVATGVYNDFTAGDYKVTAQFSGNLTHQARYAQDVPQLVEGAVGVSIQPTNLPPITEGNGGTTSTANALFTARLDSPRLSTVSVTIVTRNGAATAGADYLPPQSSAVTFQPGQTSLPYTVRIVGDTQPELTENFFVDIVAANGLIPGTGGQAFIVDDDTPTIDLVPLPDDENSGQIGFRLVRRGALGGVSSVRYATVDNNAATNCSLTVALPRCDYLPVSGAAVFGEGDFIQQVSIPAINDMYDEAANKPVRVALTNPVGAQLANPAADISLFDEDGDEPGPNKWIIQTTPHDGYEVFGRGNAILDTTQNTLTFSYQNLLSHSGPVAFYGPAHPTRPGAFIHSLPNFPATAPFAAANQPQLRDGLYFTQQAAANGAPEVRGQLQRNPADDARFFVRQNYLDFLNRQPDAEGADYWANQIIDGCGLDTACIYRRRVEVSAAFFIELEFQSTGAFVYRLYKSAFGEQANYRPTYEQFLPDRARVAFNQNLTDPRLALAQDFVTRPAFTSRYPSSQTSEQFVDAILQTVQQGSGVSYNTAERQGFISEVTNNGRGAMMLQLADDARLTDALRNRAFVLMQYFGYLRRDPDQDGYDFWLNILNSNNPRRMVCAFVTSAEYQLRFSPVATRNDQNCPTL
jgi:hypothetical protein